jgi:hypothetical protein
MTIIEYIKIVQIAKSIWARFPSICRTSNFSKRSGNKVAHQLAKLAQDQNIEHMWTDSFPSCISEIVMAEKTVF